MINIRILVVCDHGLRSSFMMGINAQETLRQLDTPSDIEAERSDITTVSPEMTDLFVCGKGLTKDIECLMDTLVLDNILDKAELRQKLSEKLQ